MFRTMSLDLNTVLKDWPYESGTVKVRKITGLDGREKLQLRVDRIFHRGNAKSPVCSD